MFQSLKKKFLLGSLIVILTTTIGATFCYLIAETELFVNVFKPFLHPYGNLTIEKMVEHPLGEDYVLPEDLTFDFEVSLGKENADREFESSLGKKVKADSNGVLKLEVKPDIPVTIKEIPAETEVKVKEIQNKKGFRVKEDEEIQSITILPQETKTLSFTNIYKPEKVQESDQTLKFIAIKKLTGRDWKETDKFSFELKHKVYDEQKKKDIWKVIDTVDVTEKKPFGFADAMQEFVFNEAKIYSFAISEVKGDIEGITYSNEQVLFDVVVGDADMDGFYEIQSIENPVNTEVEYDKNAEEYTLEMDFVNAYHETPNPKTEALIDIYKVFKDAEGKELSPAGFSFEIYSDDKLLKTSDATTAAGEVQVILGPFDKYDIGNNYSYTVKEVNAGKTIDGVTYDDSEYDVAVEINENADGTIRADVSGDKMTFENSYCPEDTKATVDGTKVYKGNTLESGAFTFALYEADKQFEVQKDEKPLKIAKNTKAGTFSFDELLFEKAGIYYYVVEEYVEEPLAYVEYDKISYRVTVSVKDIGGKLQAEVHTMDEYGEEKDIEFVNIYKPTPVWVTVGGSKTLEGKELTEGMFGFQLYEANDEYQIKGEVLQTVNNTVDGKFLFDKLNFTEAGDYYYLVKEDDSQPLENVTYDDSVYCVKIIVTDTEGKLDAEVEIMLEDGTVKEDLRFVNTYKEESDEPDKPDGPGQPDNPDAPDKPGDSDEPGEPGTTGQPGESDDAAKTGDQVNIFFYLTMFFGSGAIILAIYLFVIKKGKEV